MASVPPPSGPRRVNLHWGNYTEDNSFGTHEFIGFCRLIGAEPYFAANVGTGSPQEYARLDRILQLPKGSALSDERAANGSPEPFSVRYWGVGNELWGCGGNFTGRAAARSSATSRRSRNDGRIGYARLTGRRVIW